MKYNRIKYPVILERDIYQCILDNYTSEKTENYMNHTALCQTEEGKQSFRAGMVYAAMLVSTECFQFGNVMISEDEIKNYGGSENDTSSN